jgi:hypothetical protein
MTSLILNWIDKAIMIFAALLLLRYYFNPKASRLFKKKWVLFVCGFLFFYSIYEIVEGYRDYSSGRVPTSQKLKKTIQSEGTVLSEDVTYSSPDGYEILIPAGYKYVQGLSKSLSLSAAREGAALLIAKISDPKPLDKLGSDIIEGLKKRDSTSKLLSHQASSLEDNDALRLDWELVRKGVPVKIIMVMVKRGRTLFQLTLSCPKTFSKQTNPEFQRIIKSFTVNSTLSH